MFQLTAKWLMNKKGSKIFKPRGRLLDGDVMGSSITEDSVYNHVLRKFVT